MQKKCVTEYSTTSRSTGLLVNDLSHWRPPKRQERLSLPVRSSMLHRYHQQSEENGEVPYTIASPSLGQHFVTIV